MRVTEAEERLEEHMNALECIGSREVHAMRELTRRLVLAHFSAGEETPISVEAVEQVTKDLRAFLSRLPA